MKVIHRVAGCDDALKTLFGILTETNLGYPRRTVPRSEEVAAVATAAVAGGVEGEAGHRIDRGNIVPQEALTAW